MEKEEIPKTLKIEISRIDSENAQAVVSFLKNMEYCGKIGASRTLKFFADGDGAFRPKITTNLSWEDEIKHTWNETTGDFEDIYTD